MTEEGGSMFPTGNLVDDLEVPGVGTFKATMITAGIPTVFVNAEDIGYTGTELREADQHRCQGAGPFRKNPRCRRAAHGPDQDTGRSPDPPAHAQNCLCVPPKDYKASSGKQ
jgi:2-methylaconitate cis-trans-isomerase PrpF